MLPDIAMLTQTMAKRELGVVQLKDLDSPPLALSARFVDDSRSRDDAFPDMDTLAAAKTEEVHTCRDLHGAGFTPFLTSSVALPTQLYDLVNQKNDKDDKPPRIGVLPPLQRVWLAHGRNLLFWQYSGEQIQSLSDFGADVQSVDLVVPRRNVFIDSVKHLLLISTTETMHFYAVSSTDNLEIYDTGITIPLGTGAPRVVVDHVTGRVFFTAVSTGTSVWEARYSGSEGWFQAKSGKHCLSGPGLPMFPSLFGGQKPTEEIVDLQIDESRGLLYSLSSKSTIRIYKFTQTSFVEVTTYSVTQLQHHINIAASGVAAEVGSQVRGIRLVSLAPIGRYQSQYLRLVAVSSTGLRVYFRCDNFARDPLRTFQALYVRAPAQPVEGFGRVLDGDLYLMASAGEKGEKGRALVAAPDSTRTLHQQDTASALSFAEQAGWLAIEGAPVAVVLATAPAPALTPDGRGFGNHSALQYSRAPQELVLLTTKSVYSVRRRPFYARLELGTDPALQLSTTYGHLEVCCAALAVATRPGFASAGARENAITTYFRFGGLSVFKKDYESARTALIVDPKAALGQPADQAQIAIRLSALVDGLAAYVERLLLPIWQTSILVGGVPDSAGKAKTQSHHEHGAKVPLDVRFSASPDVLEHIHSQLTGLAAFLDNNRAFSEGLSSRPAYADGYVGDISLLARAEQTALSSLAALVRSAQQGIAFLQLVVGETRAAPHALALLLAYFSADAYAVFATMSFRDFFITAKQSDVPRELVTCLVNYVINRGDSVDSVAQVIQDKCSAYCSANDVLIYRALEYLHVAKAQPDGDARLQSLYHSVQLFKKAAASLQLDTLKDVVAVYMQFHFYPGAVQVILAAAAEVDKANTAIGFVREGRPVGDPREHAYNQRLAFYHLVFEVLAKVDDNSPAGKETFRVLATCPDESFHFALYDWFLSSDHTAKLADISSPFVLPWLLQGAKNDLRIAELLYKYYQKHGDLLAAADVLLGIGRGELPVAMPKRVEFLSRAMGYVSCGHPPALRAQATKLTSMIQSYLQIALVQSEVLEKVDSDPQISPAVQTEARENLSGKLLTITELFNDYADPLGYYEVCLAIFDVADFRDPVEVRRTWENLLTKTRLQDELENTQHYSHVANIVTSLGRRYATAEFVFPVDELVPMLEQYAFEHTPSAPPGWVVSALLNAGVDAKLIFTLVMALLRQGTYPFNYPEAARFLAADIDCLIQEWEQRARWECLQVVTDADRKEIRSKLSV